MPSPLTGQVQLTGTAQSLSATPVNAVGYTIKAPLSNAHPAYVGGPGVTASTGHVLSPGDSISYERGNQSGQPNYQLTVSDFYAVGTSGDVISWLASP